MTNPVDPESGCGRDPGEEYETSRLYDDAEHGRFPISASLQFWNSIANSDGTVVGENAAWIILIAKRVLEADKTTRRAEAMLKAVGLAGNDKHFELRRLVHVLRDFGATPAEMIASVRKEGLADHIDGDDALRVIISRELAKDSVT